MTQSILEVDGSSGSNASLWSVQAPGASNTLLVSPFDEQGNCRNNELPGKNMSGDVYKIHESVNYELLKPSLGQNP